MTTLPELRCTIQAMYAEVKSWQKVGEAYGINKAMARLIANGYQPGNKVRKIFGLPPVHGCVVIAMGQEIPLDVQIIGFARVCKCGTWFIPNTPTRKKCFICSPFRRGK